MFCNGEEACNEVTSSCDSPGDPCGSTETCWESEDQCCEPSTGTVCDPTDGNVYMADSCGHQESTLVEVCDPTRPCVAGTCSCPEGYTGSDCSQCLIYVNGATGNDGLDGRTWANAKATVQGGLDMAAYYGGCEIWVTQGTYTATTGTDRYASIEMEDGIELYGGFYGDEVVRNQRDIVAYSTVLSGEIGSATADYDNSYTVIEGADDAVIDGFTIRDGYGGGLSGAGLNIDEATMTVRNCAFVENHSGDNGGWTEDYGLDCGRGRLLFYRELRGSGRGHICQQ